MQRFRIAIATMDTYAPPKAPWFDDAYLTEELTNAGHDVTILNWRDRSVDGTNFDGIFVSSTWDECHAPDEFLAWLYHSERDGVKRLINARNILEFGLYKDRLIQSLQSHAERNVDIAALLVPTAVLYQTDIGAGKTLQAILNKLDTECSFVGLDIVLKPVISADGYMTSIYRRSERAIPGGKDEHILASAQAAQDHFNAIMAEKHLRGVLLQPYLSGIEDGEWSLTFTGLQLLNVIKKPCGFRNDLTKNRIWISPDALPMTLQDASRLIQSVLPTVLNDTIDQLVRYRLDFILQDGVAKLCEIELVSPNPNFSVLERGAGIPSRQQTVQLLAQAIVRCVQQFKRYGSTIL